MDRSNGGGERSENKGFGSGCSSGCVSLSLVSCLCVGLGFASRCVCLPLCVFGFKATRKKMSV